MVITFPTFRTYLPVYLIYQNQIWCGPSNSCCAPDVGGVRNAESYPLAHPVVLQLEILQRTIVCFHSETDIRRNAQNVQRSSYADVADYPFVTPFYDGLKQL